MTVSPAVMSDLVDFRPQWLACMRPGHKLLRTDLMRPLLDIAVDWVVVIASVVLVVEGGAWFMPVALVLIGNRQRALGNILHDAGHRNLSRNARLNDRVAHWLVAPLLLACLARYRALHLAHHRALGDGQRDPDFIAVTAMPGLHWSWRYVRTVCSRRAWIGAMAGDLVECTVPKGTKLRLLAWWAVLLGGLTLMAGSTFMIAFVALWFGARATVFHLITTFREMCDHVGLQPGGIFSFTRDVSSRGPWRWLLHPRNNGYHLTHHLCPAVPYYRLPQAHALFCRLPAYRERAVQCDAYFTGERAVTRAWAAVNAA
jgi:fatty acid desaturase